MCLIDQSGVTGGGLDPYNHYNTCFVCKHPQHVDGKIWKSTIVLFNSLRVEKYSILNVTVNNVNVCVFSKLPLNKMYHRTIV